MEIRVGVDGLFPLPIVKRNLSLLLPERSDFDGGEVGGRSRRRPLLLVALPRNDLAHLLRRVADAHLDTHFDGDSFDISAAERSKDRAKGSGA